MTLETELANIYFIILVIIFSNYFFINFLLNNEKLNFLYDYPDNKRKIHKSPAMNIGGLILILNLIICSFILNPFLTYFNALTLLFIFIFFFLGILDDIYNLNPYLRLFFLLVILVIFLFEEKVFLLNTIYFETLSKFINLTNFNYFFTIFCFLAIINAFNFFDGINGLVIGYIIIIFFYIFFKFNIEASLLLLSLYSILLYFNLKNKIFLGDSGVYVSSFILGIILINLNNNQNISSENVFLLLFLPGIDMIRVFVQRASRGQNILKPDRIHFHHYLIKNFNTKIALLICYSFLILSILIYELKIINPIFLFLIMLAVYFLFIYKLNDLK